MGRIGIFVERYTIASSGEMQALTRYSQVAHRLGHNVDYLFRPDMHKIPECDALFIRALTDPLNSSYVAARTAEFHGLRVIDDPDSIYICCDKINMYRHLINAKVPLPETAFLDETDLTLQKGMELLDRLGSPFVLKAPSSSFSLYVDRVEMPEDFVRVGNHFLRRADRIVAQRFVRSGFDWRVGVLGGKPLYACQYTIPKRRWKILSYTSDGRTIEGGINTFALEDVDPRLLEVATQAAGAIGNGLYGVDLKQAEDEYIVIEVNDNPTIYAGDEDKKAPYIYERIVRFLMDG
jgi:glutathione synthase/RimK-type ligase-like ATP-grasp enzyme